MARTSPLLVVALFWFLISGKVAAQAAPAGEAAGSAQAEARRLYAEGKVEYAQGHFGEAVALFEQAYARSGAPALLFNMAQAYRLLGDAHCPRALALYRSYLGALPQAENRREVEERISALTPCAQRVEAQAQAAPAPEPKPPVALSLPPPMRTEPALPLGPVLLVSTGAAALIAGTVLYARVKQRHDEAEEECPCYPGTLDKWKRLTAVSYALLATGSASAAGAVSWWLLAAPDAQNRRAELGVTVRF